MSFEEYINLIKKNAEEFLTGDKSKFFNVLDKLKENAKAADKKVVEASSNPVLMIPVKYKNETFAKVIACYVDDYNLAMKDMEDPEKFAAILSILNDKLAKDGDPYDVSTEENKILGLANRYANNARECQYARNWRLFAFYMRSLAYFIPQLIEKANMTEEKILVKIESALENEDDFYAEDESESGLTANIVKAAGGKILDRDEVEHDSIELKPNQWCWYLSKNGTEYAVHNCRGKLRAFKQGHHGLPDQEVQLLPDMKSKIRTISATELSYQELVNELDEKFRMVKNNLDRINARFKYRMITNVSYPLDKANKIEDEIWTELDKLDKQISKLWNKIG